MSSSWSTVLAMFSVHLWEGPGPCLNSTLVLGDVLPLALVLGRALGALLGEIRCLAGLVGRKVVLAKQMFPIRCFLLLSFSGLEVLVGSLVTDMNKCFWSVGCKRWHPLSEYVDSAPLVLGLIGLGLSEGLTLLLLLVWPQGL